MLVKLSDLLQSEDTVFSVDGDFAITEKGIVVCDTSGTILSTEEYAYTLTLPQDPEDKFTVRVIDGSSNAQDRPVRISAVNTIDDLDSDDLILDINYFDVIFIFNATKSNWSLGGK